jgi:hypothetical protein
MNYALILYTVVAMSGHNSTLTKAYDWRYLTTFANHERCIDAANLMGISSERYRCVAVVMK